MAQTVKHLPTMQETWVQSLGEEDFLEKEMAIHSSILAWRIPCLYESESEVTQSCPTLCDPMDCNLLGSSVHGIFCARVLEWVDISFSKGSS